MSERYFIYLAALERSDRIIAQLFLYALALVVAYAVLDWVPVIIRRPLKYFYLAAVLFAFVFVTVFSSGLW